MKTNVSALRFYVKDLAKKYEDILGAKEDICSENTKTGHSINFPHIVCSPTSVCSKLCYGAIRGRPITWDNSLKKFLRVYRYFLSAPTKEVAERIHREYVKYHMTFLRWNGVGDLFPKSAAVITELTKSHPEDTLLVVTRKPEMVSLIPRNAKNLYLMFSLDGSQESRKRRIDVLRRRHPRLYFSFLRRFADEDTMGARMVFNNQRSKSALPYDDPITVCPVDAGKALINNACAKCRRCFRPDVLNGERHTINRV